MKFLVVVVLCTLLSNVCSAEDAMDSLEAVSQSNWEFTNSLYSAMVKEGKASENIIFSPLSVQVILAMCYTGAAGETAEEISKGLHLPDQPDLVKSGFKQLFNSLSTSGDVTLKMANKILPDVSFILLNDYIDNVKENFLSDVENVDYNNGSNTAKNINDWVDKKTQGKISNIVSEGNLDPNTLMVLINAVYFKGAWKNAFDKELTSEDVFYVNGKVKKNVDMMHSKTWMFHWKNAQLGATMVEIPYKDNSTSMVIILPDKLDGLSSVEEKLKTMSLREVLKPGHISLRKQVELSLPRFKLVLNKQLDNTLQGLGMSEMFNAKANFSLISATGGLFVSKVMHKAMVEVNEEGTVAAAVTSVQYGGRSLMPSSVDFVVDHPFVFVLVSRKAGVVLFMGRYTEVSRNLARAIQILKPVEGKHGGHIEKKSASTASVLAVCSYVWILACIFGFLNI